MRKIICSLLIVMAPAALLAAADRALVKKAEAYLNGITGLSGGFSQISNGKKERGAFYMLRPGRVRLDYDKLPVQLISNGRDLYFYDKLLDQITTVPLSSTPAGILVRKKIDLTGADIVVSETEKSKDGFSLKMHIRDQEGIGNMTVVFSSNPVSLRSWVIDDATGASTAVEFNGLRVRTEFPKGYFELQRVKATSNSGGDSFYD